MAKDATCAATSCVDSPRRRTSLAWKRAYLAQVDAAGIVDFVLQRLLDQAPEERGAVARCMKKAIDEHLAAAGGVRSPVGQGLRNTAQLQRSTVRFCETPMRETPPREEPLTLAQQRSQWSAVGGSQSAQPGSTPSTVPRSTPQSTPAFDPDGPCLPPLAQAPPPRTRMRSMQREAASSVRRRTHFNEDAELRSFLATPYVERAMARALPAHLPPPEPPPGAVVKVVHFVRHGEGVHNVLNEAWLETLQHGADTQQSRRLQALIGRPGTETGVVDAAYPPAVAAFADAELTPKGVAEARAAGEEAVAVGAVPALVVVSPQRRAAVTGLTAFAGVPCVAHDSLCEHSHGVDWDARRSLTELRRDPALADVDLSLITDEEPACFERGEVESDTDMARRLAGFMVWLRGRPEAEVAVASHSGIMFALMNMFLVVPDGCVSACGEALNDRLITGGLRSLRLTWLPS